MSSLYIESILLEINDEDENLLWDLYEKNEDDNPEGIDIYGGACTVNLIEDNWSQGKLEKLKKLLSSVIWPKLPEDPIEDTIKSKKYDEDLLVISYRLDFYKKRRKK